jgi:hypothetical protein
VSEGFLARWSRRKKEARRGGRAPAPAERAAAPVPPAAEPGLAPEELAALPKLEELTAESDVTGFLRPGVPAALRNAALRKMWLLDPAIRDFPGHARDYAWDWNAPEGVPGSAALAPGPAVTAMVRRILGEDAPASPQAGASVDAAGTSPAEEQRDGASSDQDAAAQPARCPPRSLP